MKTSRVRFLLLPAAIAAAALTLSGCSGATDEPVPTDDTPSDTNDTQVTDTAFDMLPQNIQDAGVLRVGVSPNFPPGNFEEDNGDLNGSEIQFARALAPYLGVDVEHVPTNFAGLLTGLQAERFDVVLSGMSDTLEREEQVTFVNYLNVGANLLVPQGNPNNLDGGADLCGYVAAVPSGTNYIDMLEEISDKECGGNPIDVQTFPSGTEVVQAVATNRADFSLASILANNYFASQSNGQVESVGQVINPQMTGFVVPKDDEQLVDALASAVQAMMDSGELASVMSEWGLEDQLLDTVKINGATN